MRRKIIRQKSAYTVTLPIKWIRDHHLEGKAEVEVEEEADALIIRTEKKATLETASLTLEKSTPEYYRIMIENHYLKGFDMLNCKLTDAKAFPIIQKVVSNLIGFEVIEHKEGFCKIAATTQPSTEQFDTLLRRCFNIILYSQKIVQEDLARLSFHRLSEMQAQSDDARRFLLFCTRALHKGTITSRRDESFMHLLLERLILIEHDHYYLYTKISEMKKLKVRQEVKEFYAKASHMFDLFKEMLYKKDLHNFSEINKDWEEMYFHQGQNLFTGCTKEESIVIYHAMHLSKLIFLIAQPNITQQNILNS